MKGSNSARRCGPHGLAAKDGKRTSLPLNEPAKLELPPLPTAPPKWLPKRAASVWRERLAEASIRGTSADTDVYASFCISTALIRDYSEQLNRAVPASAEPEQKRAHARALREAGEDLRAQMRVQLAQAKELGLTVGARSRLPAIDAEGEGDVDGATQASFLG